MKNFRISNSVLLVAAVLLGCTLVGGMAFTVNAQEADPCNSEFGCFEAPLPGVSDDTTIGSFAESKGLIGFIQIVVNFVTAIIVSVGLISVVVGGYFYMTAGGNAQRVETAKAVIGAALLGIILALAAWLILNTISPQFAGDVAEPVLVLPEAE